MFLYKTVAQSGSTETTISRSRFIAHVSPISSYEEGQAFVAGIRERYKDATHNVPAMIVGNKQELQWMSDDGEPQGTAGPPILKMLADEGLTNLVVVVTRYFGGIKLGTGGLVRAYQGIAKEALHEVGLAAAYEGAALTFDVDYAHLDKLHNLAQSGLFDLTDDSFTDRVRVTAVCEAEKADEVRGIFMDVTAGRCTFLNKKTIVKLVDITD